MLLNLVLKVLVFAELSICLWTQKDFHGSAKGRLQFGGRNIFTFPSLCPLPLTKGGAFTLRQAEGKGVKRSDLRERSSQSLKDIFFSFEASQSGKELAVRSGNEHSKVNPSANFSEGRLQFGGREVFTFPPLCPLPLTKGGAFTLWQAEGKGVKRSDLRERSSQSLRPTIFIIYIIYIG